MKCIVIVGGINPKDKKIMPTCFAAVPEDFEDLTGLNSNSHSCLHTPWEFLQLSTLSGKGFWICQQLPFFIPHMLKPENNCT